MWKPQFGKCYLFYFFEKEVLALKKLLKVIIEKINQKIKAPPLFLIKIVQYY